MTTELLRISGAEIYDPVETRKDRVLATFPFLLDWIYIYPRVFLKRLRDLQRLCASDSLSAIGELNLKKALLPFNSLRRANLTILDVAIMTDEELLAFVRYLGPVGIKIINALILGHAGTELDELPKYEVLAGAINLKCSQLIRLVRLVWYDLFPSVFPSGTEKSPVVQEQQFNSTMNAITELVLFYTTTVLSDPGDPIFDQDIEQRYINQIIGNLKTIYSTKTDEQLFDRLKEVVVYHTEFMSERLTEEVAVHLPILQMEIRSLFGQRQSDQVSVIDAGLGALIGDVHPDFILRKFDRVFKKELTKFSSVLVLGDLASGLVDTALLFQYLQISPELHRASSHNDALSWYEHQTRKRTAQDPTFSPDVRKKLFGDNQSPDAVILVTETSITGASVINTAATIRERHPDLPIYIFVGSGNDLTTRSTNVSILYGLENNVTQEEPPPNSVGSGASFYQYL